MHTRSTPAGAALTAVPVGAWVAGANNTDQEIKASLDAVYTIVAVSIQGRASAANRDQFVTKFKLQYSTDDKSWVTVRPLDNPNDPLRPFDGNIDDKAEVLVSNFVPFNACYVKLIPVGWNAHISMRWELWATRLLKSSL